MDRLTQKELDCLLALREMKLSGAAQDMDTAPATNDSDHAGQGPELVPFHEVPNFEPVPVQNMIYQPFPQPASPPVNLHVQDELVHRSGGHNNSHPQSMADKKAVHTVAHLEDHRGGPFGNDTTAHNSIEASCNPTPSAASNQEAKKKGAKPKSKAVQTHWWDFPQHDFFYKLMLENLERMDMIIERGRWL